AAAPDTDRRRTGACGTDPGGGGDIRRRVHHLGADDAVTAPRTRTPASRRSMCSSPWSPCNTPLWSPVKHATSPVLDSLDLAFGMTDLSRRYLRQWPGYSDRRARPRGTSR